MGLWGIQQNRAADMEDTGFLDLICFFVLHGRILDGQGTKTVSEGNLEFFSLGYFADKKWTEKEISVGL